MTVMHWQIPTRALLIARRSERKEEREVGREREREEGEKWGGHNSTSSKALAFLVHK